MATFQHPASLNALQQFRQACSVLSHTTRASNPAWYQGALELDFQLHIRPDGPDISTYYFLRPKNQWFPGPTLAPDALDDPTRIDTFISEALNYTRSQGATSLGVVLHIADEFATTELKPEFDSPSSLPEIRDAASNDPGSILEDASIAADQASWRVMPYPAAGSEVIGTTVTVSRHYCPLLQALRNTAEQSSFPIITHALSAPLVALLGLSQSLEATPGKPFVAILQYPWFTTLGFFNEHADLRLIRTLQHRGVRRPTNFRNALATTSASLEFVDPDLYLVPLGRDVDTTMEANLRLTFTASRVEILRHTDVDGIPAWAPEPAIANTALDAPKSLDSHTLTILREESWALQDFLPTAREIAEIYPNRTEMKLLRVLRLSRVALFAFAVLFLAYFAFSVIDLIRRPEWAFDPEQAGMTKSRLVNLTKERKKLDHWNNLLADRSKAWITMEGLARMFPESRGILTKNFAHTAKPEASSGKSAKAGFVKEWKVTGFARDEAIEFLNNLNTREGINAHFNEIARATGNEAYDPTAGNRSISVNVRTQENGSFKPVPLDDFSRSDPTTYPFTFDLTITQRFESADPLAVNVPKAP